MYRPVPHTLHLRRASPPRCEAGWDDEQEPGEAAPPGPADEEGPVQTVLNFKPAEAIAS